VKSLRYTVLSLIEVVKDRITVWWLQWQIVQAKAAKYDELVENLVGLRRAIATYKRVTASVQADLEASRLESESLRSEYAALKQRSSSREEVVARTERLNFLRKILPVVVQIPAMQNADASLSARDVLEVLRPLDQMLTDMGFERIGEVGQELLFDPNRHRLMEEESGSRQAYERVMVRFVGYAFEDEILAKAEVMGVSEQIIA